jgi:HPt (histidine-containing phosphotransfer) domain-containing protein
LQWVSAFVDQAFENHFVEVFVNIPSDYWDQSRALDGVGGDKELLSKLADIFFIACPILLKSLEDSIAANNSFPLADTAQLLGRAAGNLGATRVAEAALVVETMARRSDLKDIGSACHVLRQEAQRFLNTLGDFKRERS